MAAKNNVSERCDVDLSNLVELTLKVFEENSITAKKLSICRKTRDLKLGDMVIPRGSCNDVPQQVLDKLAENTTDPNLPSMLQYSTVSSDKYNSVVFHANRPQSFKNIIKNTLTEGDNYGENPVKDSNKVVFINSLCNIEETENLPKCSGAELIRNIVVLQHLERILETNGYKVSTNVSKSHQETTDIYEAFGVKWSETTIDQTAFDQSLKSTVENIKTCPYQEEIKRYNILSESSNSKQSPVIFNLRNFIAENNLPVGKIGYDKNLSYVDVITDDGISDEVKKAVYLSTTTTTTSSNTQQDIHLLHLISQRQVFLQQQITLLLQYISTSLTQSILVFGDVTSRIGSENQHQPTFSSQQLYRLRYDQMLESSIMKYGDEVKEEKWKERIQYLTVAGLRFEMLTTTVRNNVKLDLGEDCLDNRNGSFVLYNSARLSTLFKNYHEAVKKGHYPPLPDIDEVDFTALREEEEWSLLFNYIYIYPEIVSSCIDDLGLNSTSLLAKIHIHKVANFLVSFSRSLSSYYSRIHILVDNKAHLMGTMFARLYLVKAAHQVLQNGLKLLNIEPPSQL
ncbi:hypothetical protein LOTGIDRAFT_169144 [Lottia gigantea]|uniref:DALR anticodon binding domain-containing protein n=1 Tax=Lottia gigantea TaxID=225164 RepID=V3ZS01_LOTGI|nr:hypothetical protein LOTGIDRAFT_169144 [Lottia gigantea]ESO83666.1 hypothetical protein LOTGIDRAFT_169144 [Lottia gigantea]